MAFHFFRGPRVLLCFACRASRLLARLLIDDAVSPAHILLSPVQLRQLGVRPHRRLAVTLKARHLIARQPLAVTLHPVRELRPGVHRLVSTEVDLQSLSRTELRHFFAMWLACQGSAAPEPRKFVSSPVASKAQSAERMAGSDQQGFTEGSSAANECISSDAAMVPLQSGSVLSMQSAGGERSSSFFVELSWQPGAPKDSQIMLQSAQGFLKSGVPAELGPAIELPAASQPHRSSWYAGHEHSHAASHPAQNGKQAADNRPSLLPPSGEIWIHACVNAPWASNSQAPSPSFSAVLDPPQACPGTHSSRALADWQDHCGHVQLHIPAQALGGSGWRSTASQRWRGCCRCCITPAAAC